MTLLLVSHIFANSCTLSRQVRRVAPIITRAIWKHNAELTSGKHGRTPGELGNRERGLP